jgi:cytochrome c553
VTFAARNAVALAIAFFFATAALAADPGLCVACHGEGGNSTNSVVPSIAAQPRQFISTALYMFREGYRKDPQMTPMAANLSNAEMNELAAYFSKLPAAPARHRAGVENASAGPGLVQKFHCTQCHGAELQGQQQMPRLAGQQYDYLRLQLRGFRDRKRGDLDGKMSESAQGLSDGDIDALADYIAGLGAAQ